MLKAIIVGLSVASLAVASPANSREACGPRTKLVQELAEKYGERQIIIGLAASGHVMELFASPAQEWTLVATRPDGSSCIVAAGVHLNILPAETGPVSGDPA